MSSIPLSGTSVMSQRHGRVFNNVVRALRTKRIYVIKQNKNIIYVDSFHDHFDPLYTFPNKDFIKVGSHVLNIQTGRVRYLLAETEEQENKLKLRMLKRIIKEGERNSFLVLHKESSFCWVAPFIYDESKQTLNKTGSWRRATLWERWTLKHILCGGVIVLDKKKGLVYHLKNAVL